jgi:hypothetical protein
MNIEKLTKELNDGEFGVSIRKLIYRLEEMDQSITIRNSWRISRAMIRVMLLEIKELSKKSNSAG